MERPSQHQMPGPDCLQKAIAAGDPRVVRRLLGDGADLNAPGPSPLYNTMTPLTAAVVFKRRGIMELLLERGADVNAANIDRSTALLVAARQSDTSLARTLLDHGANVNAANRSGETALHCAVDRGDVNLVQLLLARGVDLRRRNQFGISQGAKALFLAALRSNEYLVALLREAGAEDDDDGGAEVPASLSPLPPRPPLKNARTFELMDEQE